MRNFSGKVAAITGAGSGMGRSLAVELARRGCHLALGDVNERGLAQTAAICAAHGVKITSQRLDVASRAAGLAWARRPRAAPRGVPALEKAADCARPGMPLYSSA